MADNAVIREWAKANSYDVSERGAISATVKDAYNAAHPSANGADQPDYPDGMTDADFYPSAQLPDDDGPSFTEATPKSPPRASRAKATATQAKSWWRRGGQSAGGKGKQAKAKKSRVPVDELIGGAWRVLSRIAAPVPPLQRTLRVQAPVAGLILEDTVKGTVVDLALQPLAQFQRQGKAVAALLGPPMIVTALSLHLQRAMITGTEPNPIFIAFGQEALRESLMIWLDVAGPKFEQAWKREQDFEAKYGRSVDEFIAWLMSPPASPDEEDEAIRRAQGLLSDDG